MKVFWLTGRPQSGKTTLGSHMYETILKKGFPCIHVDGDELRKDLSKDLGFTIKDRSENIRRAASICKLLCSKGFYVIASFESPSHSVREIAKNIIGLESYLEIFIKASFDCCKSRDYKGNYAKALRGEINNFSGVDLKFEEALDPAYIIDSEHFNLHESQAVVRQIVELEC